MRGAVAEEAAHAEGMLQPFVLLRYSIVALQKPGKTFANRPAVFLLHPSVSRLLLPRQAPASSSRLFFFVGTLKAPWMNHNPSQVLLVLQLA